MKRMKAIPRGETYIWLTAAFLALCIIMIGGMLVLIAVNGIGYFTPREITQFTVKAEDGNREVVLGQVYATEAIPADVALSLGMDPETHPRRFLVRVGNRELVPQDFRWINEPAIVESSTPPNAVCLERTEYGHAYGFVSALRLDALRSVDNAVDAWDALQTTRVVVQDALGEARKRERGIIGDLNYRLEAYRREGRNLEHALAEGRISEGDYRDKMAVIEKAREELNLSLRLEQERVDSLKRIAMMPVLFLRTVGTAEETMEIPVASIVRAYKPNIMSTAEILSFYSAKTWEFLSDNPREANAEGGVFPAIFGTVMMVMLMTIVAVPFGVLAALYLREYTAGGPMVRLVRIAVNNLAGVPSIVFGMFGLGFFVYFVGGGIDAMFYPERLPAPTYGTGGILWASLTLALLTVPVVIVATEEALAAIPRGIREGSLALGATKWETIRRIVLPSATPGIMTGAILAMARGAGEVAPLMITGVVKLATEMPFDDTFPFFHLDRKFMHLGFHIYDVGFQTSNVEANIGMVYTTTLLLIGIILLLNLTAILVRARLRDKYRMGGF